MEPNTPGAQSAAEPLGTPQSPFQLSCDASSTEPPLKAAVDLRRASGPGMPNGGNTAGNKIQQILTQSVTTSLEYFFVYNRAIASDDENATLTERAEKILYFFPPQVFEKEEQLKKIDTCDSIIELTRKFSPRQLCESACIGSTNLAMFECEPDTWFVVAVKKRKNATRKTKRRSVSRWASIRWTGNASAADSETSVGVYPTLLRKYLLHVYSTCAFTRGPFHLWKESIPQELKRVRKLLRKAKTWQELIDAGDLDPEDDQIEILQSVPHLEKELNDLISRSPADAIRADLENILTPMLLSENFAKLHMFHAIDGLNFFPVEKATYLSIQYFVSLLHARFARIRCTALFSSGHIVWNSMGKNNVKEVYKILLARMGRERRNGRSGSRFKANGAARAGYVNLHRSSTGSLSALEAHDLYVPRVFCRRIDRREKSDRDRRAEDAVEDDWQSFRMVLYQYDTVVLALLLDDTDEGEWDKNAILEFCKSLELFVEPELAQLWQNIKRSHSTSRTGRSSSSASSAAPSDMEDDYKFLYSNDSNRVLKASSSFLGGSESGGSGTLGRTRSSDLPVKASSMGDALPTAVLHVLDDVYAKFEEIPPYVDRACLYVKAHSPDKQDESQWVMGLMSGDRRLFAIFDGKLGLADAEHRFRAFVARTFKTFSCHCRECTTIFIYFYINF